MPNITVVTLVEKRAVAPPPIEYPPLWKVMHDLELGKVRQVVIDYGAALPEVFPMLPNHFVPWGKPWQLLEYEVNDWMTKRDWMKLHTGARFANNRNGFGMSGDPRANYVTGENLGKPDPKQEALFCGGAVITGTPVLSVMESIRQAVALARDVIARRASFMGFRQTVMSLVDKNVLNVWTLNGREAAPTKQWVLDRPWTRFPAVSVNPRGEIHNLTQGGMGRMKWILLLADRNRYPTLTYPLSKLRRIAPGAPPPDPLVIGA